MDGKEPTRVVNVRSGEPYDVYVGRANPRYRLRRSKWANPFQAEEHGRERALALWREWFWQQPELVAALPELKGKVLACWCKPLACHGDDLARWADQA
jgi:hypothetical protein